MSFPAIARITKRTIKTVVIQVDQQRAIPMICKNRCFRRTSSRIFGRIPPQTQQAKKCFSKCMRANFSHLKK